MSFTHTRRSPDIPTVIKPSKPEIANGSLESRNLEAAVGPIHRDGLVVVEDVVPHEVLDHLNKKMVEDARTLQTRGENGPFNYNLGNLQQDAPPVAESTSTLRFSQVEPSPKHLFLPANRSELDPIATQITSAVLGPRPKWTFCSANAAMPSTSSQSHTRQPVHSDADFRHPDHPFALVVNIPLVTMTPENGSTELWLGTQTHAGGGAGGGVDAQEGAHGERVSGRIREALLAERRAVRPPCQPVVWKGSVVVRDLRLWHAGMPNASADEAAVRVMIAMIHFAPWYRNPMRLQLSEDIRPVLERLDQDGRLGLEVPVDWARREEALETYLDRGFGNSYDFDQTP